MIIHHSKIIYLYISKIKKFNKYYYFYFISILVDDSITELFNFKNMLLNYKNNIFSFHI